ncbi:MAG: hypothetical protein ACE5KZ_06280 [Candidatus Scalinduaceae bacterium]
MKISQRLEKERILDRILEDDRSIEKTLIRRGYTFKSNKTGLSKKLLLNIDIFEEEQEYRLYKLMNDVSNRVILKKICTSKPKFTKEELYDKWSTDKIDNLLKELVEIRAIINNQDGNLSLKKREAEFGENFEWYISEIFKREFYCTSDWGVHIVEAPNGGDYDVLARSENNLIYVECKAKKPSNIDEKEIISLLKRDEFLRSYITILLVDSTDDINSIENLFKKICLRINELIPKHNINFVMGKPPYTEKLYEHLFHFQSRLFVVNSKKPVIETFKLCLRHRHRSDESDQAIKGRFWLHELLLKVEEW